MRTLRPKLQETLAQLPPTLSTQMAEICLSPDFDASLSQAQFVELMSDTQLSDLALRLALLPVASAYALVPISDFYVGAIARGDSGRLYFGANVEFLHLGLNNSVHAEQSVISHAWLKGEKYISDITINYSPCGHCRQFMNELNCVEKMDIQLPDQPARKLTYYLPESFGPKDLNIKQRLLDKCEHNISAQTEDSLVKAAIYAANQSYSPYSHSYSAVALACDNGKIYQGRYAENAAFNPSLPPLQMALNTVNLAGVSFEQITKAVLVEKQAAKISHLASTKSLLATINPKISLRYITL